MTAKYRYFLIPALTVFLSITSCAGTQTNSGDGVSVVADDSLPVITGADQVKVYSDKLRGRKVGVIANQSSLVDGVHLVDVLLNEGIEVVRVFAPEHGFRGEAGPGDHVDSGKDPKTGLPVVSIYGAKKRPGPDELSGLDCMVFDIQDVGARFYTYISTLHYVMEACAENDVEVMVLDRPNPNGFYVDGPIMETEFSSFVGVAPIPIVHGLTVGEYALMVNGEKWLRGKSPCRLDVIKMLNYHHRKPYNLPVRPSPNLPDMASVYLYPTLCLFEGAKISVGRGTDYPFVTAGFPGFKNGTLEYTPVDIPGVIKDPPYENIKCRGIDFRKDTTTIFREKRIMLEWIVDMYNAYPQKEEFFNPFFEKLTGTARLRKQISEGVSVDEIRKSWEPGLVEYRKMREKYLLYP